jgi:regulatory protein
VLAARRAQMYRRSSETPAVRRGQPQASALDSALRLLARRAHSRAELRLKLARRGYEPDAVQAALTRLAELGYLDDAAFARGLVRRRGGGRGPLALAAELAAKGVRREEAQAALAGYEPAAQLEAATRLAERLNAARPAAGYRELLDGIGVKLLRRGFSANVVRAACQAVHQEHRSGAGAPPRAVGPPPGVVEA